MSDHTAQCVAARSGGPSPWPKMGEMTEQQRAAVLACPHWSHDAARFIWRVR